MEVSDERAKVFNHFIDQAGEKDIWRKLIFFSNSRLSGFISGIEKKEDKKLKYGESCKINQKKVRL